MTYRSAAHRSPWLSASGQRFGAPAGPPPAVNRPARRAPARGRSRSAGSPAGNGLLLSRRTFLQSAGAAGALFALGGPTALAQARKPKPPPDTVGLSTEATSLTGISSQLDFGSPADISMGWDGTVWAIDDKAGAPHLYDPLTDIWTPQGSGVDAVALIDQLMYHFRGDSYVKVQLGSNAVQGSVTKIADTWSHLPSLFSQGVHGAAYVNGHLYLFRSGLYVKADAAAGTLPSKLTDLTGWPTTDPWKEGAIDAAATDVPPAGSGTQNILLLRGSEYVTVDIVAGKVTGGPSKISAYRPWQGHLPPGWVDGGINGAFTFFSGNEQKFTVYRGPGVAAFGKSETLPVQYLGAVYSGWPAAWNPVLKQAPSGRVGGLYAAAADGTVVHHDGDAWSTLASLPSGTAVSVSAGRDGTVYAAATTNNLHQLNGTNWTPGVAAGTSIAQVAVGDGSRVWLRGGANSNAVYRLSADGGSVTPAPVVFGAASHLAANADGTVWHCTGADNNAYRFISEGTEKPESIGLAGGGKVQKVASTGFGNAYCIVRQSNNVNIQAYTSDYLFKTSESYNAVQYGSVAQGAGLVYVVVYNDPNGQSGNSIVALDAHTGDFRWRWPNTPITALRITGAVFDPVHQLLYVSTNLGTLGTVQAINVRNQLSVWAYDTGGPGIDAPPALLGTALCFGDSSGAVTVIDTEQAAAIPSGTKPQPLWRKAGPAGTTNTQVSTPLLQDGEAVVVTRTQSADTDANVELVVSQWNLATGDEVAGRVTLPSENQFVPAPPVAGTTASGAADVPAIFVNAYQQIYALSQPTPGTWQVAGRYDIPDANSHFTSGLAFGDGLLWVGDLAGRLYGLNSKMGSAFTPVQPRAGDEILTTPLVYTDSAGKTWVLFGTVGAASHDLWILGRDPKTVQPSLASVATGQTRIAQLSDSAANGVVYAAGSTAWAGASPPAGQVFAINVDRATQALRDVIVESQLMQDFDEPPGGQGNPPTHARYQSHLTLVDDNRIPLPNQALKLWADTTTIVSLDGAAPVSIGPGDDEYTTAQTGVDGSITIASGYVQSDGSDQTDIAATPLRVWAQFMDQYERVVVYPDREFHARVTTAVAVTTTDPDYDNPNVLNLQTAQNYSAGALFTSAEAGTGQPKNIADAIHAMSTSVAISGGGTSAAQGSAPPLGASAGKYLAYSDLPGGGYTPVNVAASRPALVLQPVGLSYQDGLNGSPSFTKVAHADAAHFIDTLDGQDWAQSGLAASLVGRSIFSKFWDFIKSAAVKITHIVVSIGKDIVVAFRFLDDKLNKYVFRHILQGIEEVVQTIGTFFRKLGKLIKDVIEAVSVLFHLGEIIKTHTLLRNELLNRINGVAGDGNYPGFAQLISDHVAGPLKDAISQGEQAVKNGLDNFNKLVDPKGTKTINTQQGAKSTATDLFTVQPRNQSGPPSSHSVQCTWAMKKVQQGHRQATITGLSGTAAGVAAGPLEDFLTTFVNDLTNDPVLKAQLSEIENGFKGVFKVSSATEFFERSLASLVDIFALLIEGVLAVTKALIDGLLKVVGDLIDFLFNAKTGLFTRPIKIPILSALYSQLFGGAPLTLLDLIMLVLAIPVTIVYKVLTGHYPGSDLTPKTGALGTLDSRVLRNVSGIISGVATMVWGVLTGFNDYQPSAAPVQPNDLAAPNPLQVLALCFGFIRWGFVEPQISAKTPSTLAWVNWGVAYAPLVTGEFINIAKAANGVTQGLSGQLGKLSSFVLMLCSIAGVAIGATQYANLKDPPPLAFISLLSVVLARLGGVINPFKFTELFGTVVGDLDIIGGLGSAFLTFYITAENWDKEVPALAAPTG